VEINQLHSGFRHYSVKFYWFPDGIYVLQADKKYAPIIGGKILKLGCSLLVVTLHTSAQTLRRFFEGAGLLRRYSCDLTAMLGSVLGRA